MKLIFDTHAHYDDKAFDEDRNELLTKLFSMSGHHLGTMEVF